MGIFAFYFGICLLALIVRGYYRVPQECIRYEILDKEPETKKSIIKDSAECRCHYTNFRRNTPLEYDNQTFGNMSFGNISDTLEFEPTALVRDKDRRKEKFSTVFFDCD